MHSLVTASTSSVQSRYLFTGIRKTDMVPQTLPALMSAFAWSANVLLSGETPLGNWQQTPLDGGGAKVAGGWRGQVAQIRGDWQLVCQACGLPRWNGADVMCPFCRASNVHEARLWYEVGPDAAWRHTLWSHETYMAHLSSNLLPVPSFFLPGHGIIGLRLENVMVDILHTLDLGVTSSIVGSVMFVLACLRNKFGGRTYEAGVQGLASHMIEWYKKTGCHSRIKGKLTLLRLRSGKGWAKLKAHGAATRHLTAYALYLLTEFGDVGNASWGEHDTLAIGVCQLLNRCL